MKFFPSFLRFGPNWLFDCGFALGFSSSKSQQTSSSSTSNQVTDNRVAASEGSISAGSGATVNVESSDPAAIKAAGDAIARVAESANDAMSESARASVNATQKATETAVLGNVDVTREALRTGSDQLATAADLGGKAIDTVRGQGRDALDFGERALEIATSAANKSQATTNDLIQRTNEQFTAKLAANAGDAPQAVAQDAIKYGAFALVALVGVLLFLRPTSAKA